MYIYLLLTAKIMAPAAANVFKIESAYFSVAATNRPPDIHMYININIIYQIC